MAPQLQWEGAPSGTQAFMVTLTQYGGGGAQVLWFVSAIPGSVNSLPENRPGIPVGAPSAYCGRGSGTLRYEYTLYALSQPAGGLGVTRRIDGSPQSPGGALATATLTGYYTP